nr:hypothetical protein B0A51_18147 [Rachicladosporium sp. CCFEE 5018]
MLLDRPTAPLSPPTSPRMSEQPGKANEYHWPQPSYTSVPTGEPLGGEHSGLAGTGLHDLIRPPLRTPNSFSYSHASSSVYSYDAGTGDSTQQQEQRTDSSNVGASYGEQAQSSVGGFASEQQDAGPASPSGRLTPRSRELEAADEQLDDDLDDTMVDDEEAESGKRPMTVAELRAHKRKMKRFRLTHNQTRFLMSEFARQAHPDAAHRERLSREIPGLSPRQVQVWFQNRRAKLKRLTSDDRDHMMRSRALPANFDMTSALHSPFGAAPPTMGTPMPSPSTFTTYGDPSSGVRPLTLDTLRRVPDYQQYAQNSYPNPTGMTSAMGNFNFTPPQSATETISPGTGLNDTGALGLQSRTTQESPRRLPFGFSGSPGFPGVNSSQHQMPRLYTHDRFARSSEAVASPLRTSISYSGLGSGSMSQSNDGQRAASLSEHSSIGQDRKQQRSMTNPNPPLPTSGPYGLGFTYPQIPSYHFTPDPPQPHRSPANTISAGLVGLGGLGGIGRRDSRALASSSSPLATYPSYPPTTFATSQMSHYPTYAPAYSQPPSFPSPYQVSQPQSQGLPLQRPRSQSQMQQPAPYAQLPTQTEQYTGSSGHTGGQDQSAGQSNTGAGDGQQQQYQ